LVWTKKFARGEKIWQKGLKWQRTDCLKTYISAEIAMQGTKLKDQKTLFVENVDRKIFA